MSRAREYKGKQNEEVYEEIKPIKVKIKPIGIKIQPNRVKIKPIKSEKSKFHKNLFTGYPDDTSEVPIKQWYCVNCTLVQKFESLKCRLCKENRDSDVVSSLVEKARSTKFISSKDHSGKQSTLVGYDTRMLDHYEVDKELHPHPERPDRLRAIALMLEASEIFPGPCSPIKAREITSSELQKVHSKKQIDQVNDTSLQRNCSFTRDTYANQHSLTAAKLAAGICTDLAISIFKGKAQNGFALVRPPGHHAGVSDCEGFCLFNNAAVAAAAAREAGAKRILILDWDVHHGNGTQEIFYAKKSVLYMSLHRYNPKENFYPCTGAANEVGHKGAEGFSVNIPWYVDQVGDRDYLSAFKKIVLPIASEYAPDLIIISAGFDAARGDPLGHCDVTPACFGQMTHMLASINDKLLVIMEGGYNLRSISASVKSVIEVLLGRRPAVNENFNPSASGLKTISEVVGIQSEYWRSLDCSLVQTCSVAVEDDTKTDRAKRAARRDEYR